MARGTVIGEPVVSKASTDEFRDGYDRAGLGTSETAKERGRFIWDEAQKKLVRAEDYVPPTRAIDGPIMVDRFYEGAHTQTVDEHGRTRVVDIGSRAKHRQFMRSTGLTTADDFKGQWKRDAERREAIQRGEMPSKARREVLERAFHEINEGKRKP